MNDKDQIVEPTADELAAEAAATAKVDEAEVRSSIITEFGFDAEKDKEKIDKAVAKEIKHREVNSKAIAAKIKQRELAKGLAAKIPKADGEKKTDLSSADIYILVENKVAQEDIPDVQEYATLKKITIAEALKSPIVQTILADKVEKRRTAAAANTDQGRRGAAAPTGDEILAEASKGNLPDDPKLVVDARFAKKVAKHKK